MILSDIATIKKNLFKGSCDFDKTALALFHFQYKNNQVYRDFIDTLHIDPLSVTNINAIPFLPIQFFKSKKITTTIFKPEMVFESSGTTTTINSKHYIKELALYEESFMKGFSMFYENPSQWCILGLLPSYLERKNSSLVYMVDRLIKASNHNKSGFYLNNFEELANTLQQLEKEGQKTLLIGVTFALLDFAASYSIPLKHTIVMETGGMKGRKEEVLREEVHAKLKQSFGEGAVHSEYGMTELLSQAYSNGEGLFLTPPWMKVFLRDIQDPLSVIVAPHSGVTRGIINIVDLANIYSCSFIATDDLGVLHADGRFEVLGRVSNSDLRGCSLLAV